MPEWLRWGLRWEPALLRALLALACGVLVFALLRLGAAEQQNRARFWIDQQGVAAPEYQRFRERFPATDLQVLHLRPEELRSSAAALTRQLRATPGVLEVLGASELARGWRDTLERQLPYGCDSTGACYHMDGQRWAKARELRGPLSARLGLLDLQNDAARILVFAQSQLEGAWGWTAPDPTASDYRRAEGRREPRPLPFLPRAQAWMKSELPWRLLLFGAACCVAVARRSWLLVLPAVGSAALAAAASQGVLVAARQPASIAEPSAELVIFVLVLSAALEVLSVERTAFWLAGGPNPWRAAHVGVGRSVLGLGALALGSASFALSPVAGLQSFGLQSAAGLLLGAGLVSSLVPTLAALLPQRRTSVAAVVAAAPRRTPRWQRALLLGAVVVVGANYLRASAAFSNFAGRVNWAAYLLAGAVLFGLPFALMLARHGPALLQRHWPLASPRPLPEGLQRVLDVYAASFLVLFALGLPLLLTAAPGTSERLGPESLDRWAGPAAAPQAYGAQPWAHYVVEPFVRVELVLTTPESQLTELGLARLERLGTRLASQLPVFAVVDPSLLLREAAFQVESPERLPGPWLAGAGVAARVFQHYVADQGRTARMTLLVKRPPQVSPAAFAAHLPLDSVARRVQEELPKAKLTITGPERLVAEASFDPLRLAGLLMLAIALALSFHRLTERAVPKKASAALVDLR
jgi:hypothetical protein